MNIHRGIVFRELFKNLSVCKFEDSYLVGWRGKLKIKNQKLLRDKRLIINTKKEGGSAKEKIIP